MQTYDVTFTVKIRVHADDEDEALELAVDTARDDGVAEHLSDVCVDEVEGSELPVEVDVVTEDDVEVN